MPSSAGKVLRIPMKDHLRHLPMHADVKFVFHVYQGKGTEQPQHVHDIIFPAHRDKLLAASPYFKSLLAGEWKQTGEISIENCQPGAFRILLRCIYGGLPYYNTALGSIRHSTFTAVLLAADRFGMKCLRFFDKNAAALTEHVSFLHVGLERFKEILARDSLGIYEIDLYRAAIKWARAQLKRANKRRTGQAIREVLGEALFLIRFPTMHPQDFTTGPAKDGILSPEASEKLAIYGRIHSADPSECAFNAEPRIGASSLPLRHFAPTYCQTCGARLNGDTCPECGYSYHPSVECSGCGVPTSVDSEDFSYAMCDNDFADCRTVVYRCSCGAANTMEEHGLCRCRRCGLKVWACGEINKILLEPCKCLVCREEYPEVLSDTDRGDD
ncbi:BTB/POZ domain-containing protein 2 [Aphelenchoides avenae]|nr:BTB/POZ domain-containing protein 2 [Aphelenchus avenae]